MNPDPADEQAAPGSAGSAPPPPPPKQSWAPDSDEEPGIIRPQKIPATENMGGAAAGPGAQGTGPDAQTAAEPGATAAEPGPERPGDIRSVEASVGRDNAEYEDVDYGPRRIRLSIAKIDTWSTLKLSFLLSVAVGIGIVVAAASVWLMLDGMAVFTKLDGLLQSVAGDEAQIEILQYFEFNKVVSFATIVAVADVIVITLIATLGSVIYNLVSALIGGLNITLTDE